MHKHKIILEETAISNLKQMFQNISKDSLTVTEAIKQWGRDINNKNNKKWIGVKIMQWRDFGFISPIYSVKKGHQILEGIKLTDKAREVLGRSREGSSSERNDISSVMKLIAELRKQHPEYTISFDIKLKDGIR